MSKPSRIVGLDVARSLAIIGMIVIHMASLLWSTKVILSGLPASLFAIIAGATMMIIGRNYTSATFLRLIARGALIILIGLALLPVGGQIQVVLIVMGLVMILVSWMPALGTWWRLGLFIAATIAATIVYAPHRTATDLSAIGMDCILHRWHASFRCVPARPTTAQPR